MFSNFHIANISVHTLLSLKSVADNRESAVISFLVICERLNVLTMCLVTNKKKPLGKDQSPYEVNLHQLGYVLVQIKNFSAQLRLAYNEEKGKRSYWRWSNHWSCAHLRYSQPQRNHAQVPMLCYNSVLLAGSPLSVERRWTQIFYGEHQQLNTEGERTSIEQAGKERLMHTVSRAAVYDKFLCFFLLVFYFDFFFIIRFIPCFS